MLLAVDIGNTKIKAAVFEGNDLSGSFVFDKNEAAKSIKEIFGKHPDITHSILSSVGQDSNELLLLLKERTSLVAVSHESLVRFLEVPQLKKKPLTLSGFFYFYISPIARIFSWFPLFLSSLKWERIAL